MNLGVIMPVSALISEMKNLSPAAQARLNQRRHDAHISVTISSVSRTATRQALYPARARDWRLSHFRLEPLMVEEEVIAAYA
jgi:hypothetical protein